MSPAGRALLASLVLAQAACSSSDPAAPSAAASDASTGDDVAIDAGVDAADSAVDNANDPRVKQLRDLVTGYVAAAGVPGSAFAVILDGKLFYAGGVGVRKAGGTDEVDADTLFRAGSMSKMTVAAAIETLVHDGKIDVTHPITDYVTDFKVKTPFDPTTVHVDQILSHTSGIPDTYELTCADASLPAWFQAHPMPLWTPPGVVWNYSNTNFDLAALAIETITKQSYEDAIHARVFAPAGMATATFDTDAAIKNPNHAVGSALDAQGHPVEQDFDATPCAIVGPPGGLVASVTDYARLVEAFLANGGAIMPPDRMTDMETPRAFMQDLPGRQYAFGLMLQDYGGETMVWHGGDIPGYHAELGFLPAEGIGIVSMVNGDSVKGSVPDATLSAGLAIFAHPPHAVPTPVITTPPSEWAPYVGTYLDTYGDLGTITVSLDDAGTTLSVATTGVLLGSTQGPMTQAIIDEWQMPNGILATFWREDGGAPAYFVTRLGVGVRQ